MLSPALQLLLFHYFPNRNKIFLIPLIKQKRLIRKQNDRLSPFYQQIATTNLSDWLETLPHQLKEWENQTHADYAKWSKIVDFLPDLQADKIDLKSAVKSDRTFPLSTGEKQRIIHHLKQLMPWRKGPYHLFGIHIDCEWRSDFKWDRVLPHLSPLQGRTILDVGCGSGYHMWRMLGKVQKWS